MSKSGDLRISDLMRKCSEYSANLHKVALLGYPCDEGVTRNKGKVGAKFGPACLRQVLPKLGPLVNPEFDIDIRNIHLVDFGNIDVTECLEDNHVTLTNSVRNLIQEGNIGILIGGGNDQSYCNAKALMQTSTNGGDVAVVNINAHLDARPLLKGKLAHSSSQFRQLLQDGQFCGHFKAFATQGSQCSSEHTKFVQSHGGDIVWLSKIKKNGALQEFSNVLCTFKKRDTFVSFDLDSIQASDCPGVSCPSCIGLTAQDALDISFLAGQHHHTRLFDISGYNPMVEQDRTARLVSNMIYYFMMGVATRVEPD